MKIALGSAKGLAFLHNAEQQVIHRDFKSGNILLDSVGNSLAHFNLDFNTILIWLDLLSFRVHSILVLFQNYNAKLADFGLARDGPTGDKSHVSTRVIGTQGYAAPEYLATGTTLKLHLVLSLALRIKPFSLYLLDDISVREGVRT